MEVQGRFLMLQAYLQLPRPLYILFGATVVNSIGMFVFPFAALFLTTYQKMDSLQTGLIITLLGAAYLPGGLLGGKLADHLGRKKVTVTATVISSLFFIPCGFLLESPWMPLLMFLAILFDGIADPARNAMVQDLAPPELRKEAFTLNYWGHNLGFALGPLIAGALFYSAPSWIFWGNALAIGLGSALLGFFLPESKPSAEALEESHRSGGLDRAHKGNLVSALLSRPHLMAYTVMAFFLTFVYAEHRFALPLDLERQFTLQGPQLYGWQMTFNAVLVLVLTPLLNHFTRNWRPLRTITLAALLFAGGFGMLGLGLPVWGIFLSTFIWTVGEILNAVNDEVYLATHTPMSHRGRFMAVLPAVIGLGWTTNPAFSGWLLSWSSMDQLWLLMGILALGAGAGMMILDAWDKKKFPGPGTTREPSP